MGGFVLYCFVLCSFFVVVYGVGRVLVKPKWLERQLKRQGIGGRPYKLMLGDMKEMVRLATEAWSKPISLGHQVIQRVDPFTLENVQKYGKISLCWAGTTPRLILKDPELMKQVLINKQGHFQKPPMNPQILVLTRGLTTLEGEDWARHRRILNPAFHPEKLKGLILEFATSCRNIMQQWKQIVGSQESCELDVWPQLQKLSMDVISQATFGSNYEEGQKIFQLQKELMQLTLEAMQTLSIPGFRFVPTKKNQRRKKLDKVITAILSDVIERKVNALRTGKTRVDDLLGLLLQHCNGEKNESSTKSTGLKIGEVIEECKQFYLAGQETTTSLLTWTMIVLAMHPDWQDKARQEVTQACQDKEPDYEALGHLQIVTMILYEVLRLYTPVIALYQHTHYATKIGEICVPAGVDIVLPTLLIHHDPELWGDDVGEFRPERFSEGVSKASSKDQPAFFPFGWGPRACIGQNFAMLK